jgi:Flavin-binding monooxygenase-like
VHFQDGSYLEDIDHIIFGTGYSWTLPFLPTMEIRNNRIPRLYLHVFPMDEAEDGLVFVGAVSLPPTASYVENLP